MMKYSKLVWYSSLVFILTFFSSNALAQEEARLYLSPVSTDQGNLVFDVMAENVTDLYGAEFRLSYDPALLMVQDVNSNQDGVQIEPGTLLPVDQGFVVANQVDATEGTITFAMTLLNPAPPATGTGALARVTFSPLQNSSTTIDVAHAKLVSADLQTIPSELIAFTVSPTQSGSEYEGANSTESDFPWWILAAGIMLIGGGVLIGLILFIGRGTSQTGHNSVNNAPQENRNVSSPPTGTRPSAFKQQTFPPEPKPKS